MATPFDINDTFTDPISVAVFQSSAPTAGQPPHVVVVDDEIVTRMRLQKLLEANGYRTSIAHNGRTALALVRNDPSIDMVLIDIQMPAIDGLKVIRLIRQMRSITELPVIGMTSSVDRRQMLNAFQCGANDYVHKPLDNDEVLARLRAQRMVRWAQLALKDSEERYALAARGTNDGIWDWNLVTGELYLSPRWRTMVGRQNTAWQPTGNQWMELIHFEDVKRVQQDLESHLNGETEKFETELRMKVQNNGFRWMLCRAMAIHNGEGEAYRIAGSLTDITEGKVADSLTGLPNKVLFNDRVDRCIERFRRNPRNSFAVIYMDVDDFKLINDHLGHNVGDQFLVEVAQRLQRPLRKSSAIVARLGGDEFAVLVEDVDTEEAAVIVAQRIHDQMSNPVKVGQREVLTRASMGIVYVGTGGNGNLQERELADLTCEKILSQADAAMYVAKKQRAQAYCLFNKEMLVENASQLELAGQLKYAIERDELSVHYQPIIQTEELKTLGFEALLRWNHPEFGNISPNKFIPIAESSGLIADIGLWVLEVACRQAQQWIVRKGRDVNISVNVSVRQLIADSFVDSVQDVLKRTGLPPQQLRLEVTESLLMQNPDDTIELLRKLQQAKISIGIDDFGTGYSSLSYLHQMPIDVLKIDQSFVSQMDSSKKHVAITRSIVALANSLNLQVVAEGVETKRQLNMLRELGVQQAQGFLFSTPCKQSNAENHITRQWVL